MNWFYKDSRGLKGPMPESELRKLLAKEQEASAAVRSGDNNWVPAQVVKARFARLEAEGIYLRFADKIYGPFVPQRANELVTQHRDRFDSYRVGKNDQWLPIGSTKFEEPVTRPRTASPPPPPPPPRLQSHPQAPRPMGSPEADWPPKRIRQQRSKSDPLKLVGLGCGGCLMVPIVLVALIVGLETFLDSQYPERRAIKRAELHVAAQSEGLKDLLYNPKLGRPIDPRCGPVEFDMAKRVTTPVKESAGKLIGFNIHLEYKYLDTGRIVLRGLPPIYEEGNWDGFVDLSGNVKDKPMTR